MKRIFLGLISLLCVLFIEVFSTLFNLFYGKKKISKNKSIECGKPSKNSTAPRTCSSIKPGEKPPKTIIQDLYTLPEMFDYAIKKYSNRECIGYRPLLSVHRKMITTEDGRKKEWEISEFGDVKYDTFREVGQYVTYLANGIAYFTRMNSRERFAIYCDTRREWMLIAHALFKMNITIVTVYSNLGDDALLLSLQETEVAGVFLNGKDVPKFLEWKKQLPNLKYLIYIDELPDKDYSKMQLQIKSFEQVMKLGSENEFINCNSPAKPDDIAVIMYTSGSSGKPKGVMLQHKNFACSFAGASHRLGGFYPEDIYMSYLPLAHVMELMASQLVMLSGGKIAYGTPKTLADSGATPCGDLFAFKPTIIVSVPKVCETMRKNVLEILDQKGIIAKALFFIGFQWKLRAIQSGRETPFWDRILFNTFKKKVGGRVRFFLSGGAPISPFTQTFMRVTFGAPIVCGYGLTETVAGAAIQAPYMHEFSTSNVGPPLRTMEIKLVDVPEMNYFSKDFPHPRGEIAIRGDNVCMGYFKRDDLNKESFDNEGWFLTGDIGQWLPDGSLQIIDRKKNLIKMAHGEFIAPEALEAIYANSPFVSPNGIMVHGDPHHSHLVALIIPQESFLLAWAKEQGLKPDFKSLCKNDFVRKAVLASLEEEAIKHHKKKFEFIKDCRLYSDEWTPENGLLTSAQKLKRSNLKKRYNADIREMYEHLPVV